MRALILILLIASVAAGQGRNTTTSAPLPAPGTAGTVTLSLNEYNRLVELSNRRDKQPDDVPQPFVLSRAGSNCASRIKRSSAQLISTALCSPKDR